MPVILDASALVKRYYDELDGGKEFLDDLLGHPDADAWGGLVASSIIGPEVVSALTGKTRLSGRKAFPTSDLPDLLAAFRSDLSHIHLIAPDLTITTGAERLLELHPHWTIRAGDAIHLAIAMEVKKDARESRTVLLTADRRLYNSANEVGMLVCNPSKQMGRHLAKLLEGRVTSVPFEAFA